MNKCQTPTLPILRGTKTNNQSKMKNDFITTFSTLTETEKTAFRNYIYYFYASQDAVLKVFEQVVASIKSKQDIDMEIQPSYKTFHNNLHDLKKWLIEFFAVKKIRDNENDNETEFFKIQVLQERGLSTLYTKKKARLQENLAKHPSPDIWLTLMKLRLAHNDYFTPDIDKHNGYQPQVQYLLDELDSFYIVTKLKYAAEMESRKHILQENYSPRLLNEILALLENDSTIHPIIKSLYLPLFKLTKDQSLTAYNDLKEFLIKDTVHDRIEKLAILMYLLNLTISRSRTEEAMYYQEYFDLAQIGLNESRESLFTAAGHFPRETFSNTVSAGCYLKKYTWTKGFIKDYSKYLNPNDTKIAQNFALARVHFEQKEFAASKALLNEIVQYENAHYTLHIRILLARCYYEQKEAESVQISHCNAFEKYVLLNKKLSPNLKTKVSNFLKILRFLINEKPKNQILKALDNKGESIAFSEWLKEKIDTLKS
jgi:hypothetical protein